MELKCNFCGCDLHFPKYVCVLNGKELLKLCPHCYEHEDFRAKNTALNELETTSTERNQNENQGEDPERLV